MSQSKKIYSAEEIQHMQMVQDVIARMANNSFQYKAWSVATVTALAAVFASTKNAEFFLLCLPATLLFWWLDAFHLTVETRYRRLYETIRNELAEPFDMRPNMGKHPTWEWLMKMVTKTLFPFYGLLLTGTGTAYIIAR